MDDRLTDLWQSFLAALDWIGLTSSFDQERHGQPRWDAVGVIAGQSVVVEIKAAPSVHAVHQVERIGTESGRYPVLIARRISTELRSALVERGVGYFDARGHLRLLNGALHVDAPVPAADTSEPPLRLDAEAALDVALAVLDGSASDGVRSTAELLGRSPGTVSKRLAQLRAAHLADDANRPTVPALFEATVEVWAPWRVPLADLPRPGRGEENERLGIELHDLTAPGWVLADAFAAKAWGAPVVLAGDAPPDFYVPGPATVSLARTLLGEAEFGRHACTVAAAPAPFVCRRRFDRAHVFNSAFIAPSPVVAALDLAVDPARGRETLEQWSRRLPPEVERVW